MGRTAERGLAAAQEARTGAALALSSRRFGQLQVPWERVVDLPEGLVGFPGRRRFARLPSRPGSPFETLISVEDPELAFSAGDPTRLVPGYEPPRAGAAAALGANPDDVVFLALVVLPQDVRQATIDLSAPIAIDERRNVGRQLLVSEPGLDVAVRVFRDRS
jgi:flagellar assembly factor FliW